MSNHELEPNAALPPDSDEPPIESQPGVGESVSPEPEAGAGESVSGSKPEADAARPLSKRSISERQRRANRVNARKSTGPRTDSGKQRVSQNARKLSIRLLGLAEARTLNQDLNAAGDLYRELIAPYEPAPPLLARQFEDLARLYLELEAWERIRDAQLEDRWQQSDIERRRRFHDMERDLQGTAEEIFKGGLCRQPDCAAKSREQVEALEILKDRLARRDFEMGSALRFLYGKDLNPPSDRARTISIRCAKLMDPEKRSTLSAEYFEELQNLVEREQQDALTGYGLQQDEKTMTRAACLARLAPTRDDHWMNRHAERLRHDIDRKLKLILSLLEMYGLEEIPRRRVRSSGRGNGGPEGASVGGAQGGPMGGSSPSEALPPRKPLRRNRPVRSPVKRHKPGAGRRLPGVGGRLSEGAAAALEKHGKLPVQEGRGFDPAALTHPDAVGVSPLPESLWGNWEPGA